ncbi:hypothetical protein VPH35_088435 [Triticum aestivum]
MTSFLCSKFAAPHWVSVSIDLLPRRSTSPRRQQASLPPLFTKSQLFPCVAETDPPRNPVFNYRMSGKYHNDRCSTTWIHQVLRIHQVRLHCETRTRTVNLLREFCQVPR